MLGHGLQRLLVIAASLWLACAAAPSGAQTRSDTINTIHAHPRHAATKPARKPGRTKVKPHRAARARTPAVTRKSAVSPKQPSSPATLVVAIDGGGRFRTIGEAVATARTGDTIRIRGGSYRESLVVDRDITIAGDSGAVIESTGGPCIQLRASHAVVRELTLRCPKGVPAPVVMEIAPGRPVMEDCRVAGGAQAILVHGKGAEPSFRRCVIEGATGYGIQFTDSAGGSMSDCEVARNGDHGILVWKGARADLDSVRVHHNRGQGVAVVEGGSVVMRDCEAFSDASGVGVWASTVEIHGGSLHNNPGHGIGLIDRSSGTIDRCDIYENGFPNLSVQSGSTPTITGCRIHDGKTEGVDFDRGAGELRDCDVFANAYSNLIIRTGGNPVVRHCTFHDGKQAGAYFAAGALGRVEDCGIFGNAGGPVTTDPHAKTVILNCRIR